MATQQTLQTEEFKQTELGELPKDWEVVKFEDCLSDKRVKVSKLQQSQFKKIGKFPIVDQSQDLIAGYWDNNEDLFSSPLPIVIFGDHTRTFKFIDFPFVCGPDGTKILIPEISKVFPKFFYYYLRLLKIPSRGYNRHYSLLKDYLIPLPPLPEQQKIAYVLSSIQDAQEKTDNFVNSLKELKKSSMKHLFIYGAVSFENAEKVELRETEIGLIPKSWEVGKFDDIAKQQEKIEINSDSFVSFEHIQSGTGKLLSQDSAKKFKTKTPFQKGTLLYGRIRPYLNKVWLAEFNGYCTNDIIRLRSKNSDINFVKYILLSDSFVHYATSKSQGTKMPRVKWEAMKVYPFAIPPLLEQQKIASILSAIDSKIEAEEGKKKAFGELFNSMLKDLMTAKIRVNDLEVGA